MKGCSLTECGYLHVVVSPSRAVSANAFRTKFSFFSVLMHDLQHEAHPVPILGFGSQGPINHSCNTEEADNGDRDRD